MSPPVIAPHLPPQRLLLVDDDAVLLETLQELLAGEGFQVTSATSGEAAEHLLLTARPPFELVLTDLVMPGKSGMEVLQTALMLNPSCTVLVLSGFGTIREATEAMDRGAYGLVNKPLQMEPFRQTLRRIVERIHLIAERDSLKTKVWELQARVDALQAIQGRMEMLAQRMNPRPAESNPLNLQDVANLHTRGLLSDEQFEAAKKSILAKWLL